jgi:hypothetical protein
MLTETDLAAIEARAETRPSASYASIATSDVLRLVAAARALSGEVARLESVIHVEQSFWETIADAPLAFRLRDVASVSSKRLAAALAAPGAGGEATEDQG